MKTNQSLKYLLFAGIIGVWGCSSQQYSQNKEYDDLYFSSKDREQVTLTASSTSKDYSNIENKGIASEDYSQKDVNPEYVQQYADQNRQDAVTNNNDSYSTEADNNSYYDENYSRNNNPINLNRGYDRYNNSGANINVFPSFGGYYGGAAFYDPFYDPFFFNNSFYDPFFHRPFYGRPGWNINISYNYGWGNPWGGGRNAYGYDPFYNPYRSWGGWGDSYYNNYYGRPYYGWGGGWNRNNVIIVNPSNGNSNDSRQVRQSPRNGRGSAVVNDNFNNTPRNERGTRDGRVDQTQGQGQNYSGNNAADNNRRPANISSDESRPARAVRPRTNSNPDYQPQNTQPGYNNNSGNRNSSPNVNSGASDGSITNPRAVRPRSNNDNNQNQNSNRYYENNSNRSSAPTYNSTPSTGRSPRSYDNSRSNNNSSIDNNRSSGSFNNNSSGSYSSPSAAPSRSSGSNSNSGSSGSSPRRSPR